MGVGIFGAWVVIEGGGGEVVLRRGIGLGHGLVEGVNRLGDGFKGGGGSGRRMGPVLAEGGEGGVLCLGL